MCHISTCKIFFDSPDAGRTVLNGNGKLPWELRLAVEEGVLINVDSEFDLQNIAAAAEAVGKPARILIRINPDVDPKVRTGSSERRHDCLRCMRGLITVLKSNT